MTLSVFCDCLSIFSPSNAFRSDMVEVSSMNQDNTIHTSLKEMERRVYYPEGFQSFRL
jgi:hypothetical protein